MKTLNIVFRHPALYIVITLIGISLKFINLEKRFFWDDEIATILHTSGIPMDEYEKMIPVNEIFSRDWIDQQLALNERDLKIKEQVSGLMKMPQLTPGHYYYLIFFTRIFGDGHLTYRLFSFFMFLMSLLLIFLLARKLFDSSLLAWISVALYAVSPYFQYYAQEARYNSLWAFAILLMHYLFLLALERKTIKWWVIYGLTGVFAVHTTILFYITLLIHTIYALSFYRKQFLPLFICQLVIFLSSVPWLLYTYTYRSEITTALEWQQMGFLSEFTFPELLKHQLKNMVGVFSNFNYLGFSDSMIKAGNIFAYILFLASSVFLVWKSNRRQILFISMMVFVGALVILVMDLVRGTGNSYISRYLLMNYAGVIFLAAYFFREVFRKWSVIFGPIFLLIIIGGIFSSYKQSEVLFGGRADANYHEKDAKELFSGNEKVLIITDCELMNPSQYTMFFSLINTCENENIDVIYPKKEFPDFKADFPLHSYEKIYGMYLSPDLRTYLESSFTDDEYLMLEERIAYNIFDWSLFEIRPSREGVE